MIKFVFVFGIVVTGDVRPSVCLSIRLSVCPSVRPSTFGFRQFERKWLARFNPFFSHFQKKAKFSDSDDDDFAASSNLTHNPSADRAGRQRKQVKYTFKEDEDSEDWS